MTRSRNSPPVNAALAVVVGVVVVARCVGKCAAPPTPYEEYLQNVYSTLDDCAKDYPRGGCATVALEGKPHPVGPWYLADGSKAPSGDPGPGVAARSGAKPLAVATRSEKRRGGFGATGNATSASS